MGSASGMDKEDTSAHTMADVDSWRTCDRTEIEHATERHKGEALNAESWKQNSMNPHIPMETQMSKSSSNSSFSHIENLDLNELPVEVNLLTMSTQPLNTHNTYQCAPQN